MTGREPCRAARRGRGAGVVFALHRGDSGAPDTRQDQGPDRLAPCWIDWSPVSPVKNDWSPMPPGTKLFNADNGLRVFSGLVPGVPYKLKRPPEADPAKPHAQTPRRAAALALAGMVRAAIRGAGVPPNGSCRVLWPCGSFASRWRGSGSVFGLVNSVG